MSSKPVVGLIPLLILMACGGTVREGTGDTFKEYDAGALGSGGATAASGGAFSQGASPGRAGSGPFYGGAPGAGGFVGFGGAIATGGAAAPGGASGGCCLAIATCNPGDVQVMSPNECSVGGHRCYSRSVCCSTITCLTVVDAGLPAIDSGGFCNPGAEFSRHYVGMSPAGCEVIDFGCPNFTVGFSNACGCGCEQNAGCPQAVNCGPTTGPIDCFCTDAGKAQCPYTVRAL